MVKYQKWYDNIIYVAQNRKLEGYKEKHHIIPKCLGGSNEKSNLVELTAKEHFLCHKLLVAIYPNSDKLKFALLAMCNLKTSRHQREYTLTSNEYAHIRQLVSESKKGKNSRPTKYIPSEETRRKLSEANLGQVPWNKGLLGYRKGISKTDFKGFNLVILVSVGTVWAKNLISGMRVHSFGLANSQIESSGN